LALGKTALAPSTSEATLTLPEPRIMIATLARPGPAGAVTEDPDRHPTLAPGIFVHRVRDGDSLWSIATAYGSSLEALQAANGLRTLRVERGQLLLIPGADSIPDTILTDVRGPSRVALGEIGRGDIKLLARLVRAEAEAEPYAGQVAVAAVVLNRLASARFPDSVESVIYEPEQFCVVENGRINVIPEAPHFQAVVDALRGWDPSRGALFFFNPAATSNPYMHGLTRLVVIGTHVFAR